MLTTQIESPDQQLDNCHNKTSVPLRSQARKTTLINMETRFGKTPGSQLFRKTHRLEVSQDYQTTERSAFTAGTKIRSKASNGESISSKRHSFHLVDPSPWPILGSLWALETTVGGVMYMHSYQEGARFLSLGLIFILYTMFEWRHDVLRESTLEGHHTKVVQDVLQYGFIPFIVSEVLFFFAFFWESFHSSLSPTVEIGSYWPPKEILVLDPWAIPFLNTLILLSSGDAVTWAHHAIIAGKERRAVYALVATALMALVSTDFQVMEYYQAPFTISDSVYGSTFSLATGFHGFHVIIGTLFSIVGGFRQYIGHLTKEHHVGFEAAAWYWNFVDVDKKVSFSLTLTTKWQFTKYDIIQFPTITSSHEHNSAIVPTDSVTGLSFVGFVYMREFPRSNKKDAKYTFSLDLTSPSYNHTDGRYALSPTLLIMLLTIDLIKDRKLPL
ncbi:hypothetical protein C5167_019804 [Papaver somniferum]|uniref:Cytochrome c oxidase subunit 3 n=1 Tax=Papaver somniferum TaxID=3469 RepID=A0A4Y7IUJ3_PAPSO|nr:hypothetical protein C5167_019804 [Papaver somniferum]